MTIALIIFLLVVVAPIGTIIHEIGHLLCAYMFKAEHLALHVGSGKNSKNLKIGPIDVYFYPLLFLGCFAQGERTKPFNKWETILISLSGPLINLLTVWVLSLVVIRPNQFVMLFILYNLWLALINILPFKVKNKQSDGYTVVKHLF